MRRDANGRRMKNTGWLDTTVPTHWAWVINKICESMLAELRILQNTSKPRHEDRENALRDSQSVIQVNEANQLSIRVKSNDMTQLKMPLKVFNEPVHPQAKI